MLDNKIILIGYSGHAMVVADAALDNSLNIIGYAEQKIIQNNGSSGYYKMVRRHEI